MSLQRNLVVSVSMVLLISLAAGAMLTYGHAVAKIRTEMRAALLVGQRIAENAIDGDLAPDVPSHRVARIIAQFNGDRHLRAILLDAKGAVAMQSTLRPPDDPAPAVFFNLVGGKQLVAPIHLAPDLAANATLLLETDAHNEVSEAWGDVKLGFFILFIFFCLVLGLITITLRGALRPLQELCSALTRIGAGDYAIRLSWRNVAELVEVENGFNLMADRLADMEHQNRLLQTRVHCVQEDERGDLARDLHDEVAPFLFAVSADAALIRQFVPGARLHDIDARADGILTSVAHMQIHLRRVLSRLMPDVLLDLGLCGALESLVHFWQSRRPDIAFTLSVDANADDHRSSNVIFRVVQESLSNAVRHANPTRIDIRVQQTRAHYDVEITDNGAGMGQKSGTKGFGVLGMRERVSAIGGRLTVGNRPGTAGVVVHAMLVRQDMEVAG